MSGTVLFAGLDCCSCPIGVRTAWACAVILKGRSRTWPEVRMREFVSCKMDVGCSLEISPKNLPSNGSYRKVGSVGAKTPWHVPGPKLGGATAQFGQVGRNNTSAEPRLASSLAENFLYINPSSPSPLLLFSCRRCEFALHPPTFIASANTAFPDFKESFL